MLFLVVEDQLQAPVIEDVGPDQEGVDQHLLIGSILYVSIPEHLQVREDHVPADRDLIVTLENPQPALQILDFFLPGLQPIFDQGDHVLILEGIQQLVSLPGGLLQLRPDILQLCGIPLALQVGHGLIGHPFEQLVIIQQVPHLLGDLPLDLVSPDVVLVAGFFVSLLRADVVVIRFIGLRLSGDAGHR